MKIEGIDHIEFYVADAGQSAAQLCDGYGFTVRGRSGPGARQAGYHSVLTRHGTITILFTSAADPGHPAAQYVARHGDGPAVIAFSVADGAACFAAAVRRGARLASPASGSDLAGGTVRGFGDVAHRFVTRQDPASPFAPGLSAGTPRRPPGQPRRVPTRPGCTESITSPSAWRRAGWPRPPGPITTCSASAGRSPSGSAPAGSR